jgi:Reactive mitochondrial oxygen species modulator 1
VGVIIGFIFGTNPKAIPQHTIARLTAAGGVNIMRYGAGSNGVMRTLGQYMLASGSTFGFVFAVKDS